MIICLAGQYSDDDQGPLNTNMSMVWIKRYSYPASPPPQTDIFWVLNMMVSIIRKSIESEKNMPI